MDLHLWVFDNSTSNQNLRHQLIGDAARATRPPDSLTQRAVNLLRRNLLHMFHTSTSLFIASFSAPGGIIDLRSRWLDAAINDLRWKRVFLCGPFPGTALDYLPPSAGASSSGWAMPDQERKTNDGSSATRRPRKCRGKVIFVKTWTSISHRLSLIHPLILLPPLVPHPNSLSPSPLPMLSLKSSIIFRLPGTTLQGHRGPFGLSTLKNSWFETTTAHPDDSMIWLFSAWSSFLLCPFFHQTGFHSPWCLTLIYPWVF